MLNCTLDLVRVYDGNEALRRRQYRIVSIPKHAPVQVLLVCTTTHTFILILILHGLFKF